MLDWSDENILMVLIWQCEIQLSFMMLLQQTFNLKIYMKEDMYLGSKLDMTININPSFWTSHRAIDFVSRPCKKKQFIHLISPCNSKFGSLWTSPLKRSWKPDTRCVQEILLLISQYAFKDAISFRHVGFILFAVEIEQFEILCWWELIKLLPLWFDT